MNENYEGDEAVTNKPGMVTYGRLISNIFGIQIIFHILALIVDTRGLENFAEDMWGAVIVSAIITPFYAKFKGYTATHMDLITIHPALLVLISLNYRASTIVVFILAMLSTVAVYQAIQFNNRRLASESSNEMS